MEKPVVAIVGRPNVGKSLLFNRITEKKHAIVEDTPGVTRDRIYGDAEWRSKPFVVVDTGGIEPRTDDEILKFMRQQALIAIDHAQVVILVTDIRTGVTAADMEVAAMLKKAKKPIVLAVNKLDAPGEPPAEFYARGHLRPPRQRHRRPAGRLLRLPARRRLGRCGGG